MGAYCKPIQRETVLYSSWEILPTESGFPIFWSLSHSASIRGTACPQGGWVWGTHWGAFSLAKPEALSRVRLSLREVAHTESPLHSDTVWLNFDFPNYKHNFLIDIDSGLTVNIFSLQKALVFSAVLSSGSEVWATLTCCSCLVSITLERE